MHQHVQWNMFGLNFLSTYTFAWYSGIGNHVFNTTMTRHIYADIYADKYS